MAKAKPARSPAVRRPEPSSWSERRRRNARPPSEKPEAPPAPDDDSAEADKDSD